ncbi:hypothetical protein [Enterococcus sp. DIV0170]|uniref:hypothetical protein n=1 Tax=Enterococcus sp. DIV0170 TaxID=2774642 RepID=UPI003F26FED0
MNVFVVCCLVIMGIIFLCLCYRLFVHYQLSRINVKETSVLFQTKLTHFKQRELRKSLGFLFIGTMGLSMVLSFAIIQLFQLETKVHSLTENNQALEGELQELQTKKSSKKLLKEYPSSGLNLEKTLTANNETVEKKEQIEKEVSERLLPYINEANLTLSSSSESDALSIFLTGTIEASNANLVILGQNITELMREMEGIEAIAEVHLNIVDREGNDLYKGTYARNKKGQFTFQSEMRKGKG